MSLNTQTEETDGQTDHDDQHDQHDGDPEDAVERTFTDLGVSEIFVETLAELGITSPFPIQEMTVPLGLKRADVIGQARTGTGKTLAFGLPLLESVDPGDGAVQALVVTPTRELCIQVAADLTETGAKAGISVLAIYGGVPLDPQRDALRANEVDVVVGTPGRLLDHVRRGNLQLGELRVLVLDEADRMLDMGFIPDIERIVAECPDERQTLLFSATMPTEIVGLARRYMDSPTFINAETERETSAPPETDQHFLVVHRMDKPRVLARILQSPEAELATVFVRTKRMADRLVDELRDLGLNASPIHGDLGQASRERNLEKFRSGRSAVLVATEVAARGLDIEGVTHVINYDIPDDERMYLHRIGRTGRAGAAGVAVTFAQHDEIERMNAIRKRVGAKEIEVHEVFSTSDLLTELFELPDRTPWDHFGEDDGSSKSRSGSKGKGGSKNESGSKGRSGSRGRGDDRDRSKKPRSKGGGRDRSEAAEGGGRGRSKGSNGSRRSRDDGRDRTDERAEEKERSDGAERTESPAEEPTRSRQRSRSRSGRETSDRGAGTSSAPSGGTPLPVDDDEEPVRTRTRQREQPTSSGDDGRGRSRGSRNSGGRGRSRGSGGDGDAKRQRNGRGGRSERGGRGGGRSDDAADAQSEASTPGSTPTEPGSSARGDGQPTLARRVRVENIP